MQTGDKTVKARKEHTCWLCGEKIEKGETYVRRFGFDDGPVTTKMHQECRAETLDWDELSWECMSFGEMERPRKQ